MYQLYEKENERWVWFQSDLIKRNKNDGGKLELYCKIKQNFVMEPYLKQIKEFKLRRAMTAFRISAHKLEIETGRYIKCKQNGRYVPRDDRICAICEENNVILKGDEEHALTSCLGFENERKKLFKYLDEKCPSFKELDNYNKTLYMLSCEGILAKRVSKLMLSIQSSQRPNFFNLWKKRNNIQD